MNDRYRAALREEDKEEKKMEQKPIGERLDVELLREVADLIEKQPCIFNQNNYGDDGRSIYQEDEKVECGTPCCVAGIIGHIRGYYLNHEESVGTFAKKELNITQFEADVLFSATWGEEFAVIEGVGDLMETTPKLRHAIIALRAIADEPEFLSNAANIKREGS